MRIDWMEEARRRQNSLLRDLSSLLAIPSVKNEAAVGPGAPLGVESARALKRMLGLAEREGLRIANIEGIVGYADYDGRRSAAEETVGADRPDDYIAVLSHVDVVPASGEWTTPPFEAAVRNGRLYARGALDDKGPTMAAFYGLLIVKELGLPLRHRVRLIFGTDEETGMSCMDAYNRLERPPLAGFTPDADFPIVHAEKGQVNTRMTLKLSGSGSEDRVRLRGFRSGTAANMVPDSAEAFVGGSPDELASVAAAYRSYCAERGLSGSAAADPQRPEGATMLLRMEGKSAHGMAPETGVNAGLLLLQFLDTQPLGGDDERFVHAAVELLAAESSGEALGIACRDDTTGALTVNVGLLRYAPGENEAFFHLNIRFPACADGDRLLATLDVKLRPYGFHLAETVVKPPHEVPASHPMIGALQRVYTEQTGQPADLLSTGGGTYACKLPGCVAFGPLFPGEEDTAHQPDESISVDSLLRATALYAQAIYELANVDYEKGGVSDESGHR
ncbi:dipeptidase PepV [Cohnella hongkongensis]|uniref:Dipeptidase PepV n=1 Tax=Cohnella hongkongensis TaxID=178337 RepID=A0ABV9F953_9BACL